MKPYTAYLFDLDGTLVDSAPDLVDALNRTLATVAEPAIGVDEARKWIGHGGRVMLKQAISSTTKKGLDDAEIEKLYELFVGFYTNQISKFSRPYPHVVTTLEELKRRSARMGVVSNKLEYLTVKCLDELQLSEYFNVIVGGDTLQVAKPAPEPVLYALNELATPVSDALFVGDSTTDLDCARSVGCDVAICRDGYNGGVDPSTMGADAVIDSFQELL